MALPLKSGADLYNNQALRMRLHNLGADPTEVGAGLIYFNTSTGLNTSQKARLYTGNTWKTIAFSEDLDVASNADFLALKERVDLLSGDVDTDAIISNMKEVSAFLEGFAEDASLMDYLNTELGKKLDLTGGTIDGNLQIGKSDNVGWKAINFVRNGVTGFIGNAVTKLEVGMSDGYLQIGKDILTFNNNGTYRTLLHEGNYSDLITGTLGVGITGNAATATVAESARTLLSAENFKLFYTYPNINTWSLGYYSHHANLDFETLSFRYGSGYNTAMLINSSGNVTIGGSDLAQEYYKLAVGGSTYLLASKGTSEQPSLGNIGTGTHVLIGTDSYGLEMWSRSNGNFGMQVHRFDGTATAYNLNLQPLGGNVLIGTATDDGSGAKLQVNGKITATTYKGLVFTNDPTDTFTENDKKIPWYGLSVESPYNSGVWLAGYNFITLATAQSRIRLDSTGATINGDLHVTGNIIADGEVSAGGRAEEGGNAGGGGAAEKITATIDEGLKFKEISHTLGDNVIVQVYEWNANGQTWDMILTDVETTTNLVRVRFGNETDVPHKVVII